MSTTIVLKLREVEKEHILKVLAYKKYNRTHTARELGIGIRTLQRKLKRYGVAEYFGENNEGAETNG